MGLQLMQLFLIEVMSSLQGISSPEPMLFLFNLTFANIYLHRVFQSRCLNAVMGWRDLAARRTGLLGFFLAGLELAGMAVGDKVLATSELNLIFPFFLFSKREPGLFLRGAPLHRYFFFFRDDSPFAAGKLGNGLYFLNTIHY